MSIRQLSFTLVLSFIVAKSALAGDVIQVNSTDDEGIDALPGNGICETIPGNGECTLRAAVMEANAAAEHSTIRLQAGALYRLTRENPIGPNEDLVGAGGDLDLVNFDITILGNGATVDGQNLERVFHVAGNVTANIYDLTIRNGFDVNGGGVLNVGDLTMTRCNVTLCTASNHGGGLYAQAGAHLALINSNVTSNEVTGAASLGAGIYNQGTFSASGGTIAWNTTSGQWQSKGGGVANEFGSTTISDCLVAYNQSISSGGGIWNTAALTLQRATLEGNSGSSGGGIFTDGYDPTGVSVTIEDSTILGNSPGGIYQRGATLNIRRSRIANNPNESGIYATGGVVTVLEGTTVEGHRAGGGGGIYNTANLTLRAGCVIRGNIAHSGTGGGGILNQGGTAVLDVSDSLFVGNSYGLSSTTGGAINNVLGARLTLRNSEIAQNSTGWLGAGVHNDWMSTATVSGCLFRDNGGPSRGGGVNNDNEMTIESSAFVGNSAGRVNQGNTGGGAIFNSNNASLNLTNVTISANHALRDGGGLQNQGACTITAVTFSDNTASSLGASIYQNASNGQIQLSNTIISADAAACANAGSFVSVGHNLASDNSCGLNHVTDMPSTDARLAPLDDNGGLTPTHRLLFGSPAVDNGDDALCAGQDQRAYGRPADGDNDGTSRCDVGAFEQQFADCNGNDIFDLSDIEAETSLDENGNGIPDECEVAGDTNHDGMVDLADHSQFEHCLAGAGQIPPLGCGSSDFDSDGDTDLEDYLTLMNQFLVD